MRIVIMSGLPGAGKSTYVARNFPHDLVCSADHYHMLDGVYRFNPSNAGVAHADCLRRFVIAITDGNLPLVVVDNTNTTAVEIAPYYALGEAYGHQVEVVTIKVRLEDTGRNLHAVPLDVRTRMARQLDDRVLPTRWNRKWVCGGPT